MKQNIGKTDKIVRFILAAITLYLGYIFSPWWYIATIGLVVSASMGFCLAYTFFGINTCPVTSSKK